MKTLMIIFGTRPEVIKLFPLITVLKNYPQKYKVIICNTEQQKELSNQMLDFLGITADYSLDVMIRNQNLIDTQNKILQGLNSLKSQIDIDAIIIQGDTLSAFCGALFGFYNNIPVFHLEAGLRTDDLEQPFPEEGLRQMISRLAKLHFAPSLQAKINLLSEKISAKKIYVTGNTVIDTAKYILSKYVPNSELYFINGNRKNILITVHRRENQKFLASITEAILSIAENFSDYMFIWPVHPNPNIRNYVLKNVSNYSNIKIIQPLSYEKMLNLLSNTSLILTDSGGIQEEASYLGCKMLILRNKTERKEVVDNKLEYLVGTDCQKIIKTVREILSHNNILKKRNFIYGKGFASQKIERAIAKYFRLSH